jgi:acyl-CoA synthetase (AMP-forming)/AMP-acid ligase II
MEAAATAPRAATVPLTEALGAPATTMEVWDGERFVPASWDRTAATAERVAAGLRALGVEKGTRVAAVLTNSFGACTGLLGTWVAGGVPVSLPTPARGMPLDAYAEQLGGLAQQAGARVLLVEPEFVAALASAVPDGVAVRSYESLPAPGAVEHTPPAGEDVALIQYSSGSTTSPKGCVLSARAIVTHIDLLGSALGIGKGDRGALWLPLSHDMGLFGALLMGWMRGMELRLGTPQRFLGNARTWMRDCAAWQATFTVTPNFGLRIAARAARRPEDIGTFPLRACIIGSDRIELSALEDAAAALSRYGLTFETLTPAYGLAEATLAVTTTSPAAAPHAIEVDAAALRAGEVREPADDAPTRLVSCGVPLEGVEVRIDGAGAAGVGEICVRSPCLASGYVAAPERTATTFRDGELRTGDLGFERDGELYVVGRKDDVITMGGRNVYASELETVLGNEDGVRRGNCVLLELLEGDRSRLVVLAEPDRERSDYDEIARRLRAVVAERSGLGTREVVFVGRDSLPKTASGKIQRYRARRLAGSPELDPVARVRFD